MAPSLFRWLVITVSAIFFTSHGVVSQGAIRSLHISTDVVYRFATTSVQSVIVNTRATPDYVTFLYHLPKESFVSNFSMSISGVQYKGRFEGIESKRLYRVASRNEDRGQTSRVRGTNTFQYSIRLPSRSEVTFDLVYHEVLERRLGLHSHVVYLDPGQIVPNLNISVNIIESKALTVLNAPPIQSFSLDTTSNELVNGLANLSWRAPNAAQISYNPSPQDQINASPSGISGKFIINYDVSRTSDAGQLEVINGYFVHYFAPAGYRPLPRKIVFVLDVSGSMQGEKITQLKSAMSSMLNELQDNDMFNIIVFSSGVTRWQRSLVSATTSNKDAALRWFRDVPVDGLTNIDDALTTALSDLQSFQRNSTDDQGSPYVLFLTDGDPTAGETDVPRILHNIRSYNTQRYSIFSIGFGDDVKIPFLQRISIQNGGFARKIYASSDASLQLQGFFREISSPLLKDVKITYTGNAVDETSVTRTNYNLFFNGTEIFVTGRLRVPTTTGITASVQANSWYGPMSLSKKSSDSSYGLEVPSETVLNQNMERIWAYSIIKETVRKAFETDNRVDRATLRRRTRDLSLRYSILSPATVLVAPGPHSAGEVVDIIQADRASQDSDDGLDPGASDPRKRPDNVPKPTERPQYPQPGQSPRPEPGRPELFRPKYPEEPVNHVTLPEAENEAVPFTGTPHRYTPRPAYPAEPGRPEYPEQPGRPEYPEQPGRPEYPEQPGRPQYPEEPGRPEYPEQPGRPEYPEEPERPEYPEQPGRPEYPEEPERPEYPEQPGRPEYPEEPERPEYPAEPERPEYPEEPERPEYPEEPERPEYPEEPERPEYPAEPERPEYPEEPERPEYPEEPERPEYPEEPYPATPRPPTYPTGERYGERPRPGHPESHPERPVQLPGRPSEPKHPPQPSSTERSEYRPSPDSGDLPAQGLPREPDFNNSSENDLPGQPGEHLYPGKNPNRPQPGQPDRSARPGGNPREPPSTPVNNESGVDSDPHVILDVQNLRDEYVCFDLFGIPGDIYQLLGDPVSRVTVNAKIVPRHYKEGAIVQHRATYFGKIGLTHGNTKVVVTPQGIEFDRVPYRWEDRTDLVRGDVSLKVTSRSQLRIKIGKDIQFMVLQHLMEKHHKLDTPYLGFYLVDTRGLSPYSGGILGEFVNLRVRMDISHDEAKERDTTGQLTRIDQSQHNRVTVYPGQRLNMATKKRVKCWHVRNSGRGLLKKKLKEYLMPSLV